MKLRITFVLAFALMLAAGAAMAAPDDVGKLLSGSGWNVALNVPSEGSGECTGAVNVFPSTVQSGYVILRESLGGGGNYSDIVVITNSGHKPTGTAGDPADRIILISDSDEVGVTDANLSACLTAAGLPVVTLADIAAAQSAGFVKFRHEVKGPFSSYSPLGMNYDMYSAGDVNLPGVSPATLALLVVALAMAGMLVLRRKRFQPLASTPRRSSLRAKLERSVPQRSSRSFHRTTLESRKRAASRAA